MISFLIILALAFALPAVVFSAYRFLLPVLGNWPLDAKIASTPEDQPSFSVGLVTVSHSMTSVLAAKLKQFQQLQDDLLDSRTPVTAIYAGLDGVQPSVKELQEVIDTHTNSDPDSIKWIASKVRRGKNHVLRDIVRQADSDVLLFSDVDADIDNSSCKALLAHLHNSDIGAVTGRRQIRDASKFARGQKSYVAGDDRIRAAEMKYLGSVTSSDGKLYAVKRALIDELPADVTDDLYTALGAIASGQRLVSEPSACAIIGRPAKNLGHELLRRRRVTTRGLATVWRRRSLMNPMQTGGYGIALFINKVLRRLAGPGLILAAVCIGLCSIFYVVQLHATSIFFISLLLVVSVAFFFKSAALRYLVLGVLGMSLGVWDFILGRRIERWEPRKQVAESSEVRDAS